MNPSNRLGSSPILLGPITVRQNGLSRGEWRSIGGTVFFNSIIDTVCWVHMAVGYSHNPIVFVGRNAAGILVCRYRWPYFDYPFTFTPSPVVWAKLGESSKF